MNDPQTKPPIATRFIRTGIINIVAFGGVWLAVRSFANQSGGNSTANFAIILANVLPIAMACAALLVLAGVVMKLMGK